MQDMKLENFQPNAAVRGILSDGLDSVGVHGSSGPCCVLVGTGDTDEFRGRAEEISGGCG